MNYNPPWNKGLTRETDERVRRGTEKFRTLPVWNKGLTKEIDVRIRKYGEKNKGRKCWSKGLTKETDVRLERAAEKHKGYKSWCKGLKMEDNESLRRIAEASKGRIPWNKGGTSWCKGLTKETNLIIKKRSIKHSKENHHAWKGGIACLPYPKTWTKELKEKIKKRDNYQCGNPWCKSMNLKLDVHHINYNKKDCTENNLITICSSCHTRTNHNRYSWEWFDLQPGERITPRWIL